MVKLGGVLGRLYPGCGGWDAGGTGLGCGGRLFAGAAALVVSSSVTGYLS